MKEKEKAIEEAFGMAKRMAKGRLLRFKRDHKDREFPTPNK